MQNDRDIKLGCRPCHRHGDEAALGKHDIGLERTQNLFGLPVALDDLENIGDIFSACVAAHLACLDHMVGNAMHERMLDPVLCADIVHFNTVCLQTGDQREVRRYVPGAAAAGKYDLLTHIITCLNSEFITLPMIA